MFKLNELFRLVDTKVIFYFGLTKATGTQKNISKKQNEEKI